MPTPLPVQVGGALETDWWIFGATLFTGIVTLLLFVATYLVASRTADLAKDTIDASDIADEHHQQTLWPLLVVGAVKATNYWMTIRVKNIGGGPAPSVLLEITEINGRP